MSEEAEKPDLAVKLDTMGLEALRELKKGVERAISSFETLKRQEAISAAEQVAKEHGFKLAELVGGRPASKTRKSTEGAAAPAPAYANPENPDETWSGRGRRPSWVRAALEAGTQAGRPGSLRAAAATRPRTQKPVSRSGIAAWAADGKDGATMGGKVGHV